MYNAIKKEEVCMNFTILDLETNKTFEKHFDSPYLANKFKQKVKHSKKLRIIGEWKPLY